MEITEEDFEQRPLCEITAEYYHYFDEWLNQFFDGLKSVQSWRLLFCHLAKQVTMKLRSSNSQGDNNLANKWRDILIPPATCIVGNCRLLYQALGGLRNAVPDGQHRIAGMIRVFTGYQISPVDSRKNPPRSFEFDKTFHGWTRVPTKDLATDTEKLNVEKAIDKKMTALMARVVEQVTVRILVPYLSKHLEKESESYSKVRADSQAKTKPRVLRDV